MLARRDLSGTLEHEVLEEMSEPGAIRLFIRGTHLVVQVDRFAGRARVVLHHHLEAIAQPGAGQVVVQFIDG